MRRDSRRYNHVIKSVKVVRRAGARFRYRERSLYGPESAPLAIVTNQPSQATRTLTLRRTA